MNVVEPRQHPASPRAAALCLFGGSLLIFLAFYGGDGGYLDLREYLDDAQRLWLKFDMRISTDPPVYNRYSVALPIAAGPFVWAGHLLSIVTRGALNERDIAAAVIPLLGAATVALCFLWALALGSTQRVACWAALLLAFSSSLITYTQHFYVEILLAFCMLSAVLSFARGRDSGRGAWFVIAGVALGMLPTAHVGSLPTCMGLWVGMTAILLRERADIRQCLHRVAMLTLPLFVAAAGLMAMNYYRHGNPFTTGYHNAYQTTSGDFILPRHIPGNLPLLGAWLLRTPWLAPSLVAVWLYRRERALLWPLVPAIALQTLFWLCYSELWFTTKRYLLPMAVLWAMGLPLLGQWLEKRFPVRGLAYTLIVFLMIGFAGFMLDDGIRAFYADAASGAMRCCAWYMQPKTYPTQLGTPCGALQWFVLAVLLASGVFLLVRAWKLASRSVS